MVLATGTSLNIEVISALPDEDRNNFIRQKAKELWDNQVFQNNSGAGVRGTTRITNLLPMANDFLKP